MLNKALRVENIDILILFRFFIRDIHQQLAQLQNIQSSESIRVYRGQLMSNDEVAVLKNSIGELVGMNSFLSTSTSRDNALFLINSGPIAMGYHSVLFEIDLDSYLSEKKPFANISEKSSFPSENEILLMLGSIFCIMNVTYQDNDRLCIIHMKLCDDDQDDCRELFEQMKKESGDEYNLYSLGFLLRKSCKLDASERCYSRYLRELPSNHHHAAKCYHELGNILLDRGKYDESSEIFHKSLEIYQQTLPQTHPDIGCIYLSIGAVYYRKGDSTRAISSYEKALDIFKHAYGEEHEQIAKCLNNIGVIYCEEDKFDQALEYYLRDQAICEKLLPANHPDLAMSHMNIGIIHRCLGNFDTALDHYHRSLQMKLKSLPSSHPEIANIYNSIGMVYRDKADYRQALSVSEKALKIYSMAFQSDHLCIVTVQENIDFAKSKLQ